MPKNNFLLLTNLYVVIEKDKIFLIEFGRNLKKLRKQKGFSQSQLAFEAGIQISQISRIERGLINTTIVNAKLLSKVLDVPLVDLFNFDN